MFNHKGKRAFDEAVALAQIAQQSPGQAAMHAPAIYSILRMLRDKVHGARFPSHVITPETDTEVVLNTALPHTASDAVRITFPMVGTAIGIGVEVAEGSAYRSRLEVLLEVEGTNPLTRSGRSGPGYAPLATFECQNEDGMIYMPIDVPVSQATNWDLTFRSVSAAVATLTRLTPRPFVLFEAA